MLGCVGMDEVKRTSRVPSTFAMDVGEDTCGLSGGRVFLDEAVDEHFDRGRVGKEVLYRQNVGHVMMNEAILLIRDGGVKSSHLKRY